MSQWIVLFRGINVGGKNMLPMKQLVAILQDMGFRDVRTYIQSGNVVFKSTKQVTSNLAKKIATTIDQQFGFQPDLIVLNPEQLQAAARANPFPQATADPRRLHLFFLAATPVEPDLDALTSVQSDAESFQLIDNVFYLSAPAGIGRSKLAASVEKRLGVPVTARNWRTVQKLLEMVDTAED